MVENVEKIKLRYMEKKDISKSAKLIERAYNKKYSLVIKEHFDSMLNKFNQSKFIIAEVDGEILGFVGFSISHLDKFTYQIYLLQVDPKYQNKGMGKKLMESVISEIEKTRYRGKVKPKNILISTKKPDYFKKFGFKTIFKFEEDGNHNLMILQIN